jgi:hypothetical protein
MIEGEIERGWRSRVGTALDRAEHVYLRVLRAMILIIATLMIGFAAWLAVSSLYKMSRSPDSVEEKVASVQSDELVDAELEATRPLPAEAAKPVATPEQRRFYNDFASRYYGLYQARFEPFRQADDKQLSKDEFDDSFIGSEKRLEQVASGELDFENDSADLRTLLTVMTEAADKPTTRQRLEKYKRAHKVRVANKVQRTRTEYRRGWDSYATHCAGWYESPVGCAVQRSVQVPFTETVVTMEFPKGTQSHTDLFRAFQNRYFELLGSRRDANAATANHEREEIVTGKAEGELSLTMAMQIFAGFLVLMFFFLLIAIERHQRRMSAQLEIE